MAATSAVQQQQIHSAASTVQQAAATHQFALNLNTQRNRVRVGGTKRLTNDERDQICYAMTINYCNDKLKCGTINNLAQVFQVSRVTISTIWKKVKDQLKDSHMPKVHRKYKGNQKPRVYLDISKVRDIPLHKRTNLKSLAAALNTSISTVYRLVKKGKIRRHSNAMKPHLKPENMITRLKWVLSHLNKESLNENPEFEAMYDEVHLDEKWFVMSKPSVNYYLLPDEIEPHRTVTSKKFITKIMFMAAVARPRFNADGSCLFDGKIGIFPFTVIEPAKRRSKNRGRGVLETKAVKSINRAVIKECIIHKVIPAVKEKWPEGCSTNIKLVQDNAKPHITGKEQEFIEAATSDGFNITMVQQPPNSPDCNINDLGFFRVIQGIQHEKAPRTVCQLVDAVMEAFDEIDPTTLKYVWLSLQYVMNEILKAKGNNNFKLPHVGKKRLERLHLLPEKVKICKQLVAEVMQYLEAHNQQEQVPRRSENKEEGNISIDELMMLETF